MKAVKTEYRGVVFDSKSEAIFARAMNLASCRWLYHPKPFNGHPFPDYGAKEIVLGDMVYSFVQYTPKPLVLVEYKPKRPTDTYIKNLEASIVNEKIDGMIVYGDPFNREEYTEIVLGDLRDTTRKVLPVYLTHAMRAMEYRFDLRHEYEPQEVVETPLVETIRHRLHVQSELQRLTDWAAGVEAKRNGA